MASRGERGGRGEINTDHAGGAGSAEKSTSLTRRGARRRAAVRYRLIVAGPAASVTG